MLRLQDKQLHWILLLILVAGGIFFFVFGYSVIPRNQETVSVIPVMDSFSDGWLYQKESDTEIVSFPASYSEKDGESFTFYHRVPDMNNEPLYLLFTTNGQSVKAYIDGQLIYENKKQEEGITAYHVIPLLPEYHNKSISLTYQQTKDKEITIPEVFVGTRTSLYGQLLKDNGVFMIWGGCLILAGLILLGVWCLIKNTGYAKKPLFYGSLESLVLGLLAIVQGNLLPILTGWNYGTYFIRLSGMILLLLLHLCLLRCFTYQKTVLSGIDIGVIVAFIYDISVMVLLIFHLVSIGWLYRISVILLLVAVLVYTVLFGYLVVEQKRKECRLALFGNLILVIGFLVQIMMSIVGKDITYNRIFLPMAITVYLIFLLAVSIKRAVYVEPEKEDLPYDEAAIRNRVIEQMNPNLLFASFHTLQSLIKTKSANSNKMIYYISVYMKGNLKALEKQGEIIPFSEEMEHILAYLQLQKTRNDNLKFAVECKVTEFFVPRHCIEPLVENAVKYGVGGRQNKGNVVVRTYMRAEGYAIQIIDDGIGFDKKNLKQTSNTSILYLMSQLEQLCKAQTEIISHEGKGTVITIVLPMLENDLMETTQEQTTL